jgi:hypothetical protein
VLYHTFSDGGSSLTCQPDAASWMKIARSLTGTVSGWSDLLGYWELDRSTESRTQVAKKLPG